MTTTAPVFVSRYEQRVRLVRDVVVAEASVDEQAATEVAARILHVLDTIPEKMR